MRKQRKVGDQSIYSPSSRVLTVNTGINKATTSSRGTPSGAGIFAASGGQGSRNGQHPRTRTVANVTGT
jgi:hypothetical protein